MEPSSRVSAIQSKRSNSTDFSTHLSPNLLTNIVGTSIALLTLAFPLWAVAYFSSAPVQRQPNWQVPATLPPTLPTGR
ncbi:MAG: hypothetical protein KME07_16380 [Pegethrix bostrychoides GSE-TBD4-15B]|jgi:hypothetical protein|uniref:Uncharacterized protein n=1 Tax=Pegethrix bostrychoides GSE-TBD4-15B TaxID=2839662 RepID=A0A951PC72_9CYAN|nr:hypothetical protein [Pegethrix bostrychoides GSE-TBD4-15B]